MVRDERMPRRGNAPLKLAPPAPGATSPHPGDGPLKLTRPAPGVASPRPALVLLLGATLAMLSCQRSGPARVETPADSARAEVAFRLAGPSDAAILVPVYLNGQGPFDFVLDTGATLTCLDRGLVQRLALREVPSMTMGAGVGGAGRVRVVRIDSLRVGRSTGHDLLGCELDLSQLQMVPGVEAQGLLGLNFLKEFRVTLDFGRQVVRFDAL